MFNTPQFLQYLRKLSESHYTYAYTIPGKQQKPKQFSDNCKEYAKKISSSAKGTPYQVEILRSIARHVAAENLYLAQDVISKLDPKTKLLIPNAILGFISRNA